MEEYVFHGLLGTRPTSEPGRADIMLINEFELNLFWAQSSVPGE
jgi:hypothetical protein